MRIPIRPVKIVGDIAYVPLGPSGLEFCVIDAADVPLIADRNWFAARVGKHRHVYAVAYFKRNGVDSTVRMHRLLLDALPGEDVDHKNMDTLDNRRANLRRCSRSMNMANKKVRRDSGTGTKGVYLHKNGRYRAKIRVGKKQVHIGYFATEIEASDAYARRASEVFGEFSRTA